MSSLNLLIIFTYTDHPFMYGCLLTKNKIAPLTKPCKHPMI